MCDLDVMGAPSKLSVIRNAAALARVRPTFAVLFCCLLLIDKTKTRKLTYVCWCDEGLKTNTKEATSLAYTGLCGGLEHLKIKMRLIDKKFVSVMGECDLDTTGTSSIFKIFRSVTDLTRRLSIFDFNWEENTLRGSVSCLLLIEKSRAK